MTQLAQISARRLKAMGIDLWQRRPVRMPQANAVPPRIRLAPGSGDWLLICQGGVPEDYRTLLDDILAAIGAARCRFGEWADSSEAGVAADEWQARGIEHVLVFADSDPDSDDANADRRPARARLDDPRLIETAALAEIARSGSARKQLWQQLMSRLSR